MNGPFRIDCHPAVYIVDDGAETGGRTMQAGFEGIYFQPVIQSHVTAPHAQPIYRQAMPPRSRQTDFATLTQIQVQVFDFQEAVFAFVAAAELHLLDADTLRQGRGQGYMALAAVEIEANAFNAAGGQTDRRGSLNRHLQG